MEQNCSMIDSGFWRKPSTIYGKIGRYANGETIDSMVWFNRHRRASLIHSGSRSRAAGLARLQLDGPGGQ